MEVLVGTYVVHANVLSRHSGYDGVASLAFVLVRRSSENDSSIHDEARSFPDALYRNHWNVDGAMLSIPEYFSVSETFGLKSSI